MHGRYLDDRTARGYQPLEPLARRELRNWPGISVTGTHTRDRVKVAPNQIQIRTWSDGAQPLLVHLHARRQEVTLFTEQDHARVDELLAIDKRNNPHYGIVI
jgi:hypothetical protein